MNENISNHIELKKKWLRIRDNSLRDLLQFLFHRKYWILSIFFVISISATFVALRTPNQYESDAKLLIAVGRENINLDPTIETGKSLDVFQEKEKTIRSEVAILNSQVVAEKVVNKLGAHFVLNCDTEFSMYRNSDSESQIQRNNGPDRQDGSFDGAVGTLTGGFSVEPDRYLINVKVVYKEPHCAQLFLNELIIAYNERHIELNSMFADFSYFEKQADDAQKALDNVDEKIKQFKAINNISSIAEQKTSLVAQIEVLQNKLDTSSSNILATISKINSIDNKLKQRSRTTELYKTKGAENSFVNDVRPKLLEMMLQEANLSSRFTDDYRPLMNVREQIKIAEMAISNEPATREEVTRGLDEYYTQLEIKKALDESDFKSFIGEQASLTETITQRKQELRDLSQKEVELERLLREKGIKAQEYQTDLERLQRAEINKSLDMEKISNVKVLQPPRLVLSPFSPNRKSAILIGLLLGLAAGLGVAFVVEYIDDTMNTKEDVERKLGLRVLAYVTEEEFESGHFL